MEAKSDINCHDDLLTVKQAASYLGAAPQTVYRWVAEKKIPYVKVGRLVRFRRGDLAGWVAHRTHATSSIEATA
jgi:excisionase family DNA binding protein